jgi:dTDP-4-dehydrorhamnose reductase
MKKILVTGSNGLLGQKLVYAILERKDLQVIATSVGENRLIRKDGYLYEPMDITNAANVKAVIEKHNPDVIINTAAMTNVDACETKMEECWMLNVDAVQNIVDAIGSRNIHLIHLSTDFIFDGLKGSEYTEEDKPNPLSYYASSKLESEKILIASNIKWAIARTIIVYGIVDNMSRSNIVLWAKDALSKGQKINVVDDQFRAPTLAEDLAEGCLLIAEKGATGIYNLSGPETFSILELVYKVADHYKLDRSLVTPSKSADLKQPAKRPPFTGFVIDKARKELGYSPKSFEEGLKVLDSQLGIGPRP